MRPLVTILFASIVLLGPRAYAQQVSDQPPSAAKSKTPASEPADDARTEAVKKSLREIEDEWFAHPESNENAWRMTLFMSRNRDVVPEAWDELRQRIEADVQAHPDSAEAWHRLGRLYFPYERGKAKAAFEKAIALNPNFAEAYNGLGNYYRSPSWCGNSYFGWTAKDYDFHYGKALELQQKAVLLKRDYVDAYVQIGAIYFAWKRYEDAIRAYRQVIAVAPADVASFYQLAEALQAAGYDDEAIAAFHSAIQKDASSGSSNSDPPLRDALRDHSYVAHMSLGALYRKSGQNRKALAIYETLLQTGLGGSNTHLEMGLTYLALGDKQSALLQHKLLVSKAEDERDKVMKEVYIRLAAELLEKIDAMQ